MMESRKMILRFLKSSINLLLERNNVLSLFFIIFAAAIILSTSILQFGASGDILSETMITGDSREQTVKAQRGDIYDRYGIPLP
jgi:cell division protein FtsI/penicillin-binding protein 2